MIPARISDPTLTLTAPDNWDPKVNGHCAGLPIRVEAIDGLRFMRSAWEIEPDEALHLAGGGKIILGISGAKHPVVHMVVEPVREQLTRTTLVREEIDNHGRLTVVVETLFPPKMAADDEPPGTAQRARCVCTVEDGGAPIATAKAMVEIEKLAVEQGWIPA